MKSKGNQVAYSSGSFMRGAAMAVTLIFMAGMVYAAGQDINEDRVEQRIKDMHAKFKITAEQEAQWTKIAESMREDAKKMDALTQARIDHAKDMTAVEDLKSYGDIAETHANGIKQLIPLFAELYAGMSDVQKKEADAIFRQGYLEDVSHEKSIKKSHKKSTAK